MIPPDVKTSASQKTSPLKGLFLNPFSGFVFAGDGEFIRWCKVNWGSA